MPRYLAVHTLPDVTEEGFREMLRGGRPEGPPGVEWMLTYCAFDDHQYFCEWQAPDKATLQRLFEERKTPFTAIHEVQLLDWKTKTLE